MGILEILEDAPNSDLYTTIFAIAVAQRNVLISSTDPKSTCIEINEIIDNLPGLQCNEIDCVARTIDWNQINSESEEEEDDDDGLVFNIVTNMDKTSAAYQRQQQVSSFFAGNHNIIVIVENKDGYEAGLIDEINSKLLFRLPYSSSAISTPASASAPAYPTSDKSLDLINEILNLRESLSKVTMVREITRYVNDILVYLRNHRMCARNSIPLKNKYDFELLIRTLAVLNGLVYVTPPLVRLAAEKYWPMHLKLISSAIEEPTLNWGGDEKLIAEFVKRWDQDLVILDVLQNIQAPV